MLKHGFLILAHIYLDQLSRIITLLSAPSHYFFINIDRKNTDDSVVDFIRKYEEREDVVFLSGNERMEVYHGGYSMVECTLRLLRKAMENGMDYYHLISGQDFPCKSNKEFDDFFQLHKGLSYMQMDSDAFRQKCMESTYLSRIKPWYFFDIPNRNICVVNFVARSLNYIGRRTWWRKDIPNLWGGWQWFSWDKTVAYYVVNEEKKNPSFFKRFHHTRCSDELIFATLLHDKTKELKIISDNSLRYINWEKKVEGRSINSSPLILNEEEYDEIVGSGAFFCRKVHPTISEKLLGLLERKVKGHI